MTYIDVSNRANECMLNASGQKEEVMIKSTLRGLDEINETFQDNFTNINKEIVGICSELDVTSREFSFLESQICSQLNMNLHKQPFPANSSLIDNHSLSSRHLTSSCNLQQRSYYEDELLTADLLRKIEKKVHLFGNTTSKSLASVLKKLRVVKEGSERHTRALNELRKEVEIKIENLRDLAKIDPKSSVGK